MKNNLLLTLLLAAGSLTSVYGATLTPEESLRRALGNGPAKIGPVSPSELVLSYTAEMSSSTSPALYVFTRPNNGGFLITAADDCAPALLGSSANGTFDYDKLPPSLKWWLDQYSRQIEWASENTVITVSSQTLGNVTPKELENVETLMSTTWNQDEPYNLYCPEYSGERSVTGCVATAMAQVIRYHEWPEGNGNGSNSYTCKGKQLSYDFSANSFDWDNMIDSYYGDSSQTQKDAVANLMYACGVAVNMNYSPVESGAFTENIAYALTEFFGYDKAASFLMRDCYTQDQWNEIVYNEIASGRPVLYGGNDGQYGHQFVCDGYTDGYFHINWGWGGYCDGDFLLSALDPTGSGIGGGSGSYNFGQSIIAGVGRPGTVDNFAAVSPIVVQGSFNVSSYEEYSDCWLLYTDCGTGGGMFNHSRYELSGSLGYCLKTADGELIDYIECGVVEIPGINTSGNLYGFVSYGGLLPKISDAGTYHIYPAFKEDEGEWERLMVYNSGSQYVVMTVAEDGTTTFTNGQPLVQQTLEVTAFYTRSGYIVSGEATTFFVDCKNGDINFNGIISLYASESGSEEETLLSNLQLQVEPNLQGTFSFYYSIYLPAGNYDFYFKDSFDNLISPKFPMEVKELVLATSLTLDPSVVEAVEGDEFVIKPILEPANVTNTELFWSSSDEDVAFVDQDGFVTVKKQGHATIFAETTDGSDLVATCAITSMSGIEFVKTADLLWDVVTPTGVIVRRQIAKEDISGLQPGLYILRNGSRALKIVVE